jgi:N-acetylglucosaminyl-diphospho-decaprenol L-rhamnosyltransferase
VNRLAIIIVAFNARDDLARALESLTTTPPHISHEIIVVDNASTDGAAALVRDRFPQVRVIDAGRNLGFAKANNLGIRTTAADGLLVLNPDTLVPAGAIDRLVARLAQLPLAAIIGPRIVDAGGHAELSFGGPVTPWREAARKTLLAFAARGIGPARRWIERRTAREREVHWVTGACLLVRRADAEAVGLFDERYFLYMEDVDFCAAVRARGRRVVFSPIVEIIHRRGQSRAGMEEPTRDAWNQSHLAYYRKHLPKWAPMLERYVRWTRRST